MTNCYCYYYSSTHSKRETLKMGKKECFFVCYKIFYGMLLALDGAHVCGRERKKQRKKS